MSDSPPPGSEGPAPVSRKIEWLLGLTLAAMLAVVAVPGIQTRPEPKAADPTVHGLERLLVLARDGAMANGDDHFVLLEPTGAASESLAMLFRDLDHDGRPEEAELIDSVSVDRDGELVWGSALAQHPANGDAAEVLRTPWSFADPGDEDAVRGLVFGADGVPHAITASGRRGVAGSGAGGLYLHRGTRDYAVVLSPWGDVEVQVWDVPSRSWQLAATP